MYSEIFNLINTKSDLSQLLHEAEFLYDSLFKTKTTFEQTLQNQVRPSIAVAMQNSLNNSKIDRAAFLKGLKVEIEKFHEATLVLAYEPAKTTFEIFGKWVRDNLADMTVLDISIDQTLVAGAILVYKGKYVDLSFKRLINDYFVSHKDKIKNSFASKEVA